LLFQTDSPFYARTGRKPGGVVLDDQKESAWSVFSQDEQRALQRDAKSLLRDKLRQAVTLSGTYELDDAAVSHATREAFEAANAGPTPQPPPASFASATYSGGGGGGAFDNGLAGYQSVSFEHNSSTNSGGTPNSKPPKYSGGVGAFHHSSTAAASPQPPQFSSSSPPHHNSSSSGGYAHAAPAGSYGSPGSNAVGGNKRGSSAVMTSAALRATTHVEEFDFDDDDVIPLTGNTNHSHTTAQHPQEQTHYQQPHGRYPYPANSGKATSLLASPPPALPTGGGGYHQTQASMDSSGLLLAGRGSGVAHRSMSSSVGVASSGGAVRAGNPTGVPLHHSQHLSMFDKHNNSDYATVTTTATTRRPTAAVADGFDSDVDVVELEDDLVATGRSALTGTTSSSMAQKQTPPPLPQRTADIDDLMTELFPARKS
jgi:hypothetical protein